LTAEEFNNETRLLSLKGHWFKSYLNHKRVKGMVVFRGTDIGDLRSN